MKSGEQHSIFVVGIGHAGCQILSKLETDSGFSNSVYVSSVLEDFPHSSKGLSLNINMKIGGSLSIPMIRSLCKEQIDIISDSIKSADCVITKLCHDNDIKCIPVLSMPYDSETHRHFNAGTTLTKIKQYSSNIILIDNDEILESLPRIPISEAFNLIYSKIALSLSSLFSNNTW